MKEVLNLKILLNYDMESGIFTWAIRRGPSGEGSVAGTIDKYGYRVICINRKLYRAHRLAWLYVTGAWPANDIDHINGIRHDNSFKNLREATRSQNNQNRNAKGYYWHKQNGVWQAQIKVNRNHIYLGCFKNEEEARDAYLTACSKYHKGFTDRKLSTGKI